ncbi:MAG: hypothetical protein GIW94_03050 [Candidatus Eremiobacteraeota bacterium]|nr:hypothetical protein [Candidatus Eremiobacteraeota bacterium]
MGALKGAGICRYYLNKLGASFGHEPDRDMKWKKSQAMKPLILIEFNELSPRLLERFMAAGKLPNFGKFYAESTVFVTDAREQVSNLEPWIQWPTVHSGLSYDEHRVFHLGDGRNQTRKYVAEILSDAGIRAGVFGSMNMNYRALKGYVIADPWDKDTFCSPGWLQPFCHIVAKAVQESSNDGGLSKKDLARLALFLGRHGMKSGTFMGALTQVLAERRDPGLKWRRPSLLDQLQYDLFVHLNRRYNVQFATFFSNSTAHYQHFHWRDMDPELFDVPPDSHAHPSMRSAILYGYQSMDDLMGRFMRDNPNALLMFCTALSQQPWTDTTKVGYRPRDFNTFLEFAEIPPESVAIKPVMAQQFYIDCPNRAVGDAAEKSLGSLFVGEEPLMWTERAGDALLTGCRIHATEETLRNATVRRSDGGAAPFGELFYKIHAMRSGRHHGDGALWVRNGRHEIVASKAALTQIAPTILAHFSVPRPPYMQGLPLSDKVERFVTA